MASEQEQDTVFKPIHWVYDPLDLPTTERCICFIHSGGSDRSNQNSIRVDPESLRLPWPSSFCAARQCNHWPVAEEAALELIEAIFYVRGRLPRRRGFSRGSRNSFGLDDLPSKERSAAINAVNCSVYLAPEAGPRRIALITKVLLLTLLHHDAAEFDPEHQSYSIVSGIIDDWPIIVADPDEPIAEDSHVSTALAKELVNEDSILGRGVMNGLLQYLQVKPRARFADIRDFLNHRAMNLAAELVLACVRFANDIQVSPSEMAELSTFIRLVPDHFALVSDLYSYEKGNRDLEFRSARITNTVNYLEQLLSVQPACGKKICLQLVEETESNMRQEMERLRVSTDLTDNQLRYIFAMIDCVAGNVLFSLTSKLYGGDAARRYEMVERAQKVEEAQPKVTSILRRTITNIQQRSSFMMKISYRRFVT